MGEKETAGADEAERSVIKTKTKSNQSNDRMDTDDDGDLVADDSDPAAAALLKNKTKSNQSNDRLDAGGGGDLDGDGAELDASERAAGGSKPRQAYQGFRTGEPGDEPPLTEGAINNTKSNIKNLSDGDGGITHEDDWESDAAKLAPERPVKSEIAIGDPGVNGNLAVSEPGVGAATPKKTN